MTWFKVDDSFYDHPKVFDAPDCAVALWTRAGCWSARNLTRGFVPASLPARLCGDPDTAVRDLLRRGLWSRASGGYQFHDWTDYNPTKEKVLSEREANAERQRRYREKQRNGSSNGVTHAVSNKTPTRPDPPPKGGEGRRRATPAARADPTPTTAAPRCDRCALRTDDPRHQRTCEESA